MSPEPIRDYVGEALARSANGKAATFDTNSGGGDATSPPNQGGFNGGGFQAKSMGGPRSGTREATA